MPPLPIISGRQCVATLANVGFVLIRQRGSHMILQRADPATTISVPDHTELDRGTLRAIIRQAGLTVEQFLALR
ncbi:type II toxin-antitoxin system HicA family toxin [Chloroflexales bacterium ZM16-3]|nr:type II toxin-antitoxin system HicA family toxin [Chloroflexales bacterium ZM16-3]